MEDGDKIRFREGYPEKIGGWAKKVKYSVYRFCPITLKPWLTLESDRLVGCWYIINSYIEDGGVFYDITPIRDTTAAGDVTFSAATGTHVITVTDTNHEVELGDFVTLVGLLVLVVA